MKISIKRLFTSIILVIAAILLNILLMVIPQSYSNDKFQFWITAESDIPFTAKIYYILDSQPEDMDFSEGQSVNASYGVPGTSLTMGFTIPAEVRTIRLDVAETDNTTIDISNIHLNYNKQVLEKFSLEDDSLSDVKSTSIAEKPDDGYSVTTEGTDSQMIFKKLPVEKNLSVVDNARKVSDMGMRIAVCALLDLLVIIILVKWNSIFDIPSQIWKDKGLILRLGRNDFRTRFAGSMLGTVWAFVQPIVTVFVYWFVFEKALNAGTQSTKAGIAVPFVLWLLGGLVPWFFFSDSLSSGTNVMMEYSYLVKKVVFHIEDLPVVKIVSAFFVHVFFIVFTVLMYTFYGYFPDLYMLQMLYYTLGMVVLVTGCVYLSCSIVVFFRDWSQIINIILQVGVWFTPIMWNIDAMTLPVWVQTILKFNPMYYVVMGYRDSLINQIWFWQRPFATVYFWAFSLLLFIAGTAIFKKLKVHFADVL